MQAPSHIRESHRYRPDIDVLRAIAVLSVVLFHAGVEVVAGGFVGVDIFFVVSGYLISKHLIEEARATGRVDIRDFYRRRLRRIAPVLLTVLFVTAIFAFLLLFPASLESFAISLLSSLGFFSNIYFWQESGYFAAQDSNIPLLHTWSLSIEEQFYLFIPVLILILARWKKALYLCLLLAFVLSFSLSVWQSPLRPGASFYLLPTRVWELLFGTLTAVLVIERPRMLDRLPAGALAVIGFGAIAWSLFAIDEGMAFPGWVAFVPCLGTALVILSGRDAIPWISRVLAQPPVLMLGLISYSLYLWHWPVIVFQNYLWPDAEGSIAIVPAIAIPVALAFASYYLIEVPTRRKSFSFRALCRVSAGGTAALLATAAVALVFAGLPQRFPATANRLAAAPEDGPDIPDRCLLGNPDCRLGADGETPSAVVIGDSYAAALAPAFDAALEAKGIAGASFHQNSCKPLTGYSMDYGSRIDARNCLDRNMEGLVRVAQDPAIKTVYLVSRDFEVDGSLDLLARTVALFRSASKAVVVLYGLPKLSRGSDLPLDLARAEAFGLPAPILTPDRAAVRKIEAFAARERGASYIDLEDTVCSEDECAETFGGQPIYRDDGHLTRSVSRALFGDYLADRL